MTVKELIRELEQFDGSLTIIYQTQEDMEEPSPQLVTWNFNTSYYTGNDFIKLPKDVPFVML